PHVAPDRRVAVFATCLVEYRRPQIGHALVDVYSRNGIACDVAGAGCCGAPWLTSGDTRRFAERAAQNVAVLATAIRAGADVVVAQPTCHAVITTDYVDHVGGSDAELVAARTFDAVQYLADLHAIGTPLDTRFAGEVPARIVHHDPCPPLDPDAPSAVRELLELTGARVDVVACCTGVDGRWGLRAPNAPIALATAAEIGAAIERFAADVITGGCVLANTAITEQTGRVPVHPLEALASAYGRIGG
ncbi:MAG: heterodisulfide reductase-related iron-sulfur binding cluster, partial [Ilumatobacteraceae bacterium]